MSAKEFYQANIQPVPILADVPPEIWATIIEYAAEINHEDPRTSPDPMDFIADVDRGYRRALRSALVCNCRVYIVRVV